MFSFTLQDLFIPDCLLRFELRVINSLKRSSSAAPSSSVMNGNTGSYTKTEGSDDFSIEESSSEAEIRTLPSSQTQYKLLNGDVIAR